MRAGALEVLEVLVAMVATVVGELVAAMEEAKA